MGVLAFLSVSLSEAKGECLSCCCFCSRCCSKWRNFDDNNDSAVCFFRGDPGSDISDESGS